MAKHECDRPWCICKDDDGPSTLALVCGSRTWTDHTAVEAALLGWSTVLTGDGVFGVISGGARGADTFAANAATTWGWPLRVVNADWDRHGKAAGPIRNREMLAYKPDVVLAFTHDLSVSKGTRDMVQIARKAGVPTYVIGGGLSWGAPGEPGKLFGG